MITISWYYDYTIAYKNPKDGKLYPVGPFDNEGELRSVVSKSRSFASDLHERFTEIQNTDEDKALISKELFKGLYSEADEKDFYEDNPYNHGILISYLPFKDLPTGSFIKKGYCLIDDIEAYENPDNEYFEGFYGVISPSVYAKKMENELKFGRPQPIKDEFGDTYTPHSMADYSYYCYPDYESEEYEAFIIHEMADILVPYNFGKDEKELYVVLTQG